METQEDYMNVAAGIKFERTLKISKRFVNDELLPELINIKPLSMNKTTEIHRRTQKQLKDLGLEGNENIKYAIEASEVVWEAIYEHGSDKKLYESPQYVRNNLTVETIDYLAKEYQHTANLCNPSLDNLTANEVEELKKKLLNGESLIGLGYPQLVQFTMEMVQRISILENSVKQSSTAKQANTQKDSFSSSQHSAETSSEKIMKQEKKQENKQSKTPIYEISTKKEIKK